VSLNFITQLSGYLQLLSPSLSYGRINTKQSKTSISHRTGQPVYCRESYNLSYNKEQAQTIYSLLYPDNLPSHCYFSSKREAFIKLIAPRPKPQGEAAPGAKLTNEDVQTIRESYASGEITIKQLAINYGIGKKIMAHVVHGKSYKNAPGPIISPKHKLSSKDVQQIRESYSQGITVTELANQYDKNSSYVRNIIQGKERGNAPGPTCILPSRHSTKLTPDDVRRIRREHAQGCKQVDLAKKYGVTPPCIGQVIRRVHWKDVKDYPSDTLPQQIQLF